MYLPKFGATFAEFLDALQHVSGHFLCVLIGKGFEQLLQEALRRLIFQQNIRRQNPRGALLIFLRLKVNILESIFNL